MAAKLKGLQQWCKTMCEGYRDVNIVNMTSSWKSGLAFCALIHKFRPDLIDYDSLSKENVYENNKLAFETAKEHLGIPALLDAEDMVAMRVPDRLCIITYVSQYLNYYNSKGKAGVNGRTPVKRPTPSSPPPDNRKTSKGSTVPPDSKVGREDSGRTPSKRSTMEDTCCICRQKVYVLERHMEGSKLFHRRCIREQQRSVRSPSRTSSYRSGSFTTDETEKGKENRVPTSQNTTQGGPSQPYGASKVAPPSSTSHVTTAFYQSSKPTPTPTPRGTSGSDQTTGTSTSRSGQTSGTTTNKWGQPTGTSTTRSGQSGTTTNKWGQPTGTSTTRSGQTSGTTTNKWGQTTGTSTTRSGQTSGTTTNKWGQTTGTGHSASSSPASAPKTSSSTVLLKSIHSTPQPYKSSSDTSSLSSSRTDTKSVDKVSPGSTFSSSNMYRSQAANKSSAPHRTEEKMEVDPTPAPPVNFKTYPKPSQGVSAATTAPARHAQVHSQSKSQVELKPANASSSQVGDKAMMNGLLQSLAKVQPNQAASSSSSASPTQNSSSSSHKHTTDGAALPTSTRSILKSTGETSTDGPSRSILKEPHTSGHDHTNSPHSILKSSSLEDEVSHTHSDESAGDRKSRASKPILKSQNNSQEDLGPSRSDRSVSPPKSILKTHPASRHEPTAEHSRTPKPILKSGEPSTSPPYGSPPYGSPPYGSPPKSILKSSFEEDKHLEVNTEAPRSILKHSSDKTEKDVVDKRRQYHASPNRSILKTSAVATADGSPEVGKECTVHVPVRSILKTNSRSNSPDPHSTGTKAPSPPKSSAESTPHSNKFSALNMCDSMKITEKTISKVPSLDSSPELHSKQSHSANNFSAFNLLDSMDFNATSGKSKSTAPAAKTAWQIETEARSVVPAKPQPAAAKPSSSGLSQSQVSTKPEWQLEAERRNAARGGKYQDPEFGHGAVSIDKMNRRVASPSAARRNQHRMCSPKSSPKGSPRLDQKPVDTAGAVHSKTTTTAARRTAPVPVIPDRSKIPEIPKRPVAPAETTSSKPQWQMEAERRNAARNGKYPDPERNPQQQPRSTSTGTPSYGGMDVLSIVQKQLGRTSPTPPSSVDGGNSPEPSGSPRGPSPIPAPRRASRAPHRPPPPVPQQPPATGHNLGVTMVTQHEEKKKIVPDMRFSFRSDDFSMDANDHHHHHDVDEEERPPPPRPPPPSWARDRPLPPLPCCNTPKRRVNAEARLATTVIMEQLEALDATLQCLEGEGRTLEEKIRAATGTEEEEVGEDDLMVEWFELVNQKNELVRKESDLMYRRKQQELEDLHEELEYELRCLMDVPEHRKMTSDKIREKALLQELLETVSLRNHIVDSIEDDRIRYIEEDQEIAEQIATRGFTTKDDGKKKGKDKKKNGKKNGKWKNGKDKKDKNKGKGKDGGKGKNGKNGGQNSNSSSPEIGLDSGQQ